MPIPPRLCALILLAAWSCLAACMAQAAPAAAPPPYTLDHTEVIATPAARLKRAYEIYVSLPADYARTTRRYPVGYVTDAPYAFPLIRAIAGRVNRHGVGLEDFILVGLGDAQGDSGVVSRNRDHTPTDRGHDPKKPEAVYGQGGAYLEFLAQDGLPRVDARYRTDPGRRIYVGHSYGSLLGLQAMLERPGLTSKCGSANLLDPRGGRTTQGVGLGALLFSHHIPGSPSLGFDRGQPFEASQRHAKTHTDLAAQVRFYVGGLERPTRQRPDDEDMVAQLHRYVAALRGQRWHALDVQASVLDGEDHATVFPRLFTQGLMWALPRPASGNGS